MEISNFEDIKSISIRSIGNVVSHENASCTLDLTLKEVGYYDGMNININDRNQ